MFIYSCVFFFNFHMFDLNSRFVCCHVMCFGKQMFVLVVEHHQVVIGKCVAVDYKHCLTTFNQAMSCSFIFMQLLIVTCLFFVCQSYFVWFLSVDLLQLFRQFVDCESHREADQAWGGPSDGVE